MNDESAHADGARSRLGRGRRCCRGAAGSSSSRNRPAPAAAAVIPAARAWRWPRASSPDAFTRLSYRVAESAGGRCRPRGDSRCRLGDEIWRRHDSAGARPIPARLWLVAERPVPSHVPPRRLQPRRTRPQGLRRRDAAHRRRRPRAISTPILAGGRARSIRARCASRSPMRRKLMPRPVAPMALLAKYAADSQPKIIYTNSSVEYWGTGRAAASMHTSIDGTTDLTLPANVRSYHFAGIQHGPAAFPPRAAPANGPNARGVGAQLPQSRRRTRSACARWCWRSIAGCATASNRRRASIRGLSDGTLTPVASA